MNSLENRLLFVTLLARSVELNDFDAFLRHIDVGLLHLSQDTAECLMTRELPMFLGEDLTKRLKSFIERGK